MTDKINEGSRENPVLEEGFAMKYKNGTHNGSGTATAPARDSNLLPGDSERLDPERERRIAELKHKVQRGDYAVPVGQVAKKIIDEHLR